MTSIGANHPGKSAAALHRGDFFTQHKQPQHRHDRRGRAARPRARRPRVARVRSRASSSSIARVVRVVLQRARSSSCARDERANARVSSATSASRPRSRARATARAARGARDARSTRASRDRRPRRASRDARAARRARAPSATTRVSLCRASRMRSTSTRVADRDARRANRARRRASARRVSTRGTARDDARAAARRARARAMGGCTAAWTLGRRARAWRSWTIEARSSACERGRTTTRTRASRGAWERALFALLEDAMDAEERGRCQGVAVDRHERDGGHRRRARRASAARAVHV